jgi:carbon-monoxide dehydrogenase small subunit
MVSAEITPNLRLIDLLRQNFGLTGAKEGCGVGECGACTVILDKQAVNSCLILAVQADSREIITIEGISDGDRLHPLQESFMQHGAVQCGFCTPGMILSAYSLLLRNPQPGEDEIREAIAGNLCRCTGYKQIIEAIKNIAQ